MSRFLFLLFIFSNALLQSVAVESASPPISAELPSGRKLGKPRSAAVGSSSPSEAPRSEAKVQGTSSAAENSGGSENQTQLESREHHRSRDKSIAGGGVILGGLATTFLVAIICYIRATRRHATEVK